MISVKLTLTFVWRHFALTMHICVHNAPFPAVVEEQEIIELVPNIILNPGFDGNPHREHFPADENSNSETTLHLNNNTVVQPRNL